MKGWNRRSVLGAALALLAGAPFGLRGCADVDRGAALEAALTGWLDDVAATTVGKRVLALGPKWSDAAAHRTAIAARLSGAEAPATSRSELADAVSEDFAATRMVQVEGWLLAETEARLYALAALRAAATG